MGSCECWWNPETGYRELCPTHEAEIMDEMMEFEARRAVTQQALKAVASGTRSLDPAAPQSAPLRVDPAYLTRAGNPV